MTELKSDQEFKDALAKHSNYLVIVLFKASFADKDCQAMWDAIQALVQSTQPNSIVAWSLDVDADACEKTVKDLKIEVVPTVLLFAKSKPVDRVAGLDVTEVLSAIKQSVIKHYPLVASLDGSSENSLDARLKSLISSSDLFIFMKGTPSAPRCQFSRKLMAILDGLNTRYKTFDILSDEEMKCFHKTASNWPTYPAIYWKGELLGGLDILTQLVENGDFQKMLQEK